MQPVKTAQHAAVLGKDRKGQSLYAIASARVGQNRAKSVVAFIMQWSIAMNALDVDTLSLQEYADYWGETRRTAFRHQSEFREAFPGHQTPTGVVHLARRVWDAKQGVSGLSAAVLPAI